VLDINPAFVEECCWQGFMPMAASFDFGEFQKDIFLAKYHNRRSLILSEPYRPGKTLKKRARSLQLSIKHSFEEVVRQCIKAHGDDWLRPLLIKNFFFLQSQRHISKTRVRFLSCELSQNGILLAGEFGYLWGSIYTSLSGFYLQNGCGTLQMCCLQALLFKQGLSVWDLGMDLEYKRNLGAQSFERKDYLDRFRKAREAKSLDLKYLEDQPWACEELLKGTIE